MSNNIFLELRESNAQENYENGSWRNVLQDTNKTTIEEGDQIVVNKSYIDTNSVPQQEIRIPENLNLVFQCIPYMTKAINNDASAFDPFDTLETGDAHNINCALNYVPTLEAKETSISNVKLLKELTFTWDYADGVDAKYGGLQIGIQITNAGGEIQMIYYDLPSTKIKNPKATNVVSVVLDLLVLTGAGTIAPVISYPPASQFHKKNTIATLGGLTDINHDHYVPHLIGVSITLPTGDYTPQGLCKVINRQLQQNDVPLSGDWSSNKFCSDFEEFTTNGTSNKCFMTEINTLDRPDNFSCYSLNTNQSRRFWIGASQMELAYDEDTSKFFWAYLHMPYYEPEGGAEALQYRELPAGPDAYFPKYSVQNKLGGVMFKALFAETIQGEIFDFWEGLLKFNVSDMLVSWNLSDVFLPDPTDPTAPPVLTIKYPRMIMKEGLLFGNNATGAFASADSLILKKGYATSTADTFTNYPQMVQVSRVAPDANNFLYFSEVSTTTNRIEAIETSTNRQDQFGYFLIDLQCGYLNNYLNDTSNSRNIKSIVGKFYTQQGYTTGSEADSIAYTHIGDPMVLTDFSIRILNPDRVIPTNIGDDNTIIVNIIKNPKNL